MTKTSHGCAWGRRGDYALKSAFEETELEHVEPIIQTLRLEDRTAFEFYKLFQQLNQNRNKNKNQNESESEKEHRTLAIEQLCSEIGVPKLRSKFVDRLFRLFDKDKKGTLSFHAFLQAGWNVCTLTDYLVAAFGAKVFKKDAPGSMLSIHECDALVRMVHDVEQTPSELRETCMGLGDKSEGMLGVRTLASHCKDLFQPVYELQDALRSKVLGRSFWIEETKRRTETFGAKATIEEVLQGKRLVIMDGHNASKQSVLSRSESGSGDGSVSSRKASSVVPEEMHIVRRPRALTNIDTLERSWKKVHQAEARYAECDMKNLHDKARLKHELTVAVQHLLESQKNFFAQEETRLYTDALSRVEEQAEDFFALKQGQKHLQEVGREIALRRFKTDMFGRLNKRDLAQGMKLAREEYISKYSREATKEAKAEVERHKHDLQRDLEGITKEHKILSVADERILDWQWERKYDSESGYHFFSCEATGATIWEEPHLPNIHGHCEESGCKERAVIRCIACSEEFCESCDRVIHSVGQKKNHKNRMDIPWEELDWRKKARDVLLEHADKIQQPCQDLVEIERRRLARETRAH